MATILLGLPSARGLDDLAARPAESSTAPSALIINVCNFAKGATASPRCSRPMTPEPCSTNSAMACTHAFKRHLSPLSGQGVHDFVELPSQLYEHGRSSAGAAAIRRH